MCRLSTAGLYLAILMLGSSLSAANSPIVGYIVDNCEQTEGDEPADSVINDAHLNRAGHEYRVFAGMQVFAGDVLSTGPESTFVIAFVDNSAVTLRASTELGVVDYAYPQQKTPTHLALKHGEAFFAVNPRPADAHFFIDAVESKIEVKGTRFSVISNLNSDGATFTTTVGVTDGTVNLQPNVTTATSTDILSGTQLVMTVATGKIPGYAGKTVSVSKGNLTASQIKALEKSAASYSNVSVAKNGVVSIKSVFTNPDGSVTTSTQSSVAGDPTKIKTLNSSTKAGKTVVDKVTRSGSRETVVMNDQAGTTTTEKVNLDTGTGTVRVVSSEFGRGSSLLAGLGKNNTRVTLTGTVIIDKTTGTTSYTASGGGITLTQVSNANKNVQSVISGGIQVITEKVTDPSTGIIVLQQISQPVDSNGKPTGTATITGSVTTPAGPGKAAVTQPFSVSNVPSVSLANLITATVPSFSGNGLAGSLTPGAALVATVVGDLIANTSTPAGASPLQKQIFATVNLSAATTPPTPPPAPPTQTGATGPITVVIPVSQ